MMQLDYIKYKEHEGGPQEWTLEGFQLAKSNLIVGKNASGKSRTISVIGGLAANLSGRIPIGLSANFECRFSHETKIYEYFLHYEQQQVISEKLLIDGTLFLERGEAGEGSIYFEQLDSDKLVRFQTPTSELAATARRDTVQHSFLEPIHLWASSLRHHQFGTNIGKDNLAIFQQGAAQVDDRDQRSVVGILRTAIKEFSTDFTDAMKSDLASIDYYIEDINVAPPISIRIDAADTPPSALMAIYVKERDLPGITDQFSMSQGMFRVVSLLISINYFNLKKIATCILIDDIGEGLDFDRSCRLINLLRRKAEESALQIVMSTNDRFVMNSVPLEEWSIVERKGNHVSIKNYHNSREIFEDFKFTGLSNFNFFELDVIKKSEK